MFIDDNVSGNTLPEAYHKALAHLLLSGDEVPCPDYNTNQKELSMTMKVLNPLTEPMISKLFIGGPKDLEQYKQEMLDGILDFEVDNNKWDYTYHRRMTMAGSLWQDQIQFVIDELRKNPYSRRAVIDVRDADADMYSEDPACLQHLQFFVRDDSLHLKVLFRSNDACKASFMNAFALIMLQKRIADELGYKIGTYTHRANSFHCYERDYKMLEGYVSRITTNNIEELAYNYVGDWDELMNDEKPSIEDMVEQLRSNTNE